MVQIINEFGYAGAEQAYYRLVEGLDSREFEVIGAQLQSGEKLPTAAQANCDRVISLRCRPRFLLPTARLAALLREVEPDIVHCHLPRAGYAGAVAACRAGTGSIAYTVQLSWAGQSPVNRALEREVFRRCDAIISVSRAVLESLPEAVRRARHSPVIPNSVDVDGLEAMAGAALPADLSEESGRLICASGRLHRQKGLAYLLRAMPAVLARHPHTVLLIIGDGPLGPALRRATARLGIASSVRFLGYREDRLAFVRASELVVMPSLAEGLPLALLEACALQTPVIASSADAIAEVVQHEKSALLVPPGDPEALARRIIEALDSPERMARLAASAYETVRERYAVEATVHAHEQLYRELAEQSPR